MKVVIVEKEKAEERMLQSPRILSSSEDVETTATTASAEPKTMGADVGDNGNEENPKSSTIVTATTEWTKMIESTPTATTSAASFFPVDKTENKTDSINDHDNNKNRNKTLENGTANNWGNDDDDDEAARTAAENNNKVELLQNQEAVIVRDEGRKEKEKVDDDDHNQKETARAVTLLDTNKLFQKPVSSKVAEKKVFDVIYDDKIVTDNQDATDRVAATTGKNDTSSELLQQNHDKLVNDKEKERQITDSSMDAYDDNSDEKKIGNDKKDEIVCVVIENHDGKLPQKQKVPVNHVGEMDLTNSSLDDDYNANGDKSADGANMFCDEIMVKETNSNDDEQTKITAMSSFSSSSSSSSSVISSSFSGSEDSDNEVTEQQQQRLSPERRRYVDPKELSFLNPSSANAPNPIPIIKTASVAIGIRNFGGPRKPKTLIEKRKDQLRQKFRESESAVFEKKKTWERASNGRYHQRIYVEKKKKFLNH